MEPQNSGQSGREPPSLPPEQPGEGGHGEIEYPVTRSVVRAWVRERLNDSTLRDIAGEVGVAKHSVEKLLAGTNPKKTWPRWKGWYVVDRASRSTKEEADEVAALVMHYAMLPAFREDWARASRELADAVEKMCASRRQPVPEWVASLRESGEMGIMQPRPTTRGRKRGTRAKDAERGEDPAE